MTAGVIVATLGLLVMSYGLWVTLNKVPREGRLPSGARQLQLRGMAVTILGIGVMVISIGQIATYFAGTLVIIQGLLMYAFADRIERRLD